MRPMEFGICTTSTFDADIKSSTYHNVLIPQPTQVLQGLKSGSQNDKFLAKSNAKSRRKSALPLRASPLGDSSHGDDSQTSQSSLDDNSNSTEDSYLIKEESLLEGDTHNAEQEGKAASAKEDNKSRNDIKCNMCEKLFQYKSEFDSHYQTSYNQTPVYTCMYCNRTMEKYSSFRSHCYRHITEGRFKCEECGQGFQLQSHLQVHIIGKHTKVKPFGCDECGKEFATKSGLKIHVKRHQGETKEQYTCAECGKILLTRGGLTSHMNVHRLGRRFMCDVCGKTFTQKVNMQQHVKQHTGDKPYECDKCGKTFAEKSHLSRHNSFHTEDRPFKCEICGKMYKTERCLKVHSLVHGKDRPYVCTHCNKGFLSSTKLKQHYNIHTGERPFACKYCERKFTNYPNLLKHTRRKHNVDHKTGKDLPRKQTSNPSNPEPDLSPHTANNQLLTSDFASSEFNHESSDSAQSLQLEIKSEMMQQVINSDNDHELSVEFDPDTGSYIYKEDYDDYEDTLHLPHFESIDNETIHHDNLTTDFKLSKNDELYLQKRILNFPMTDNEPKDSTLVSLSDLTSYQSTSSHYDLVPFI